MGQVDHPRVNAPKTKVTLTEDVWEMAIGFVKRENERNPLYRVSLRGVVNQAVREFVERQDDGENASAA